MCFLRPLGLVTLKVIKYATAVCFLMCEILEKYRLNLLSVKYKKCKKKKKIQDKLYICLYFIFSFLDFYGKRDKCSHPAERVLGLAMA